MQKLERPQNSMTGFQKATIFLLSAILLVLMLFVVIYYTQLNNKAFTPVKLSQDEHVALQDKLNSIDSAHQDNPASASSQSKKVPGLIPEAYSGTNATRQLRFTEREINALLANNTQLAQKIAIDLSTNLASANILLPLDPEFPILGGKTLKLNAGVDLRFTDERPAVKLVGVSLWGVPIPNAWLGGLKNIDLVDEFGTEKGFWKAFSDGIDALKVEEESVLIQLKE